MDSYLLTQAIDKIHLEKTLERLETGSVLFFPDYFFSPTETKLLSENSLDGTRKNISYDPMRKSLSAHKKNEAGLEDKLKGMMQDYADFAYQLLEKALPTYAPHLQWGRTSFRPAQISGRASSKRKDDTRLHVDSFAASPVNGLRILRVFCNINPDGEPRVWHLGESFSQVLHRFAPNIKTYSPLKAKMLKWIKATKSMRSAYDHYMLNLHDQMKLDEEYQSAVSKVQVSFPAQSTWIVYTDQVSHAALRGQHVLEQTFYLPISHMGCPEHSPLQQWNKIRPEVVSA